MSNVIIYIQSEIRGSQVSTDAGVRQRGQPRPWLCTSLAHDSQKRHQRDPCITRCYKTHIAEVYTAAASADTVVWRTGVVTGVVIILMLCIVIRSLGVVIVVRV